MNQAKRYWMGSNTIFQILYCFDVKMPGLSRLEALNTCACGFLLSPTTSSCCLHLEWRREAMETMKSEACDFIINSVDHR